MDEKTMFHGQASAKATALPSGVDVAADAPGAAFRVAHLAELLGFDGLRRFGAAVLLQHRVLLDLVDLQRVYGAFFTHAEADEPALAAGLVGAVCGPVDHRSARVDRRDRELPGRARRLTRVLLGHATHGDGYRLVEGVLREPFPDVSRHRPELVPRVDDEVVLRRSEYADLEQVLVAGRRKAEARTNPVRREERAVLRLEQAQIALDRVAGVTEERCDAFFDALVEERGRGEVGALLELASAHQRGKGRGGPAASHGAAHAHTGPTAAHGCTRARAGAARARTSARVGSTTGRAAERRERHGSAGKS